jgi:hypothetical protein
MKIRVTIPMIAFALALVRMSVRAHTCVTTADSAPAVNVTNHESSPAIRALPLSRCPSLDASRGLSNSTDLNLEGGASARTARYLTLRVSRYPADKPFGDCRF